MECFPSEIKDRRAEPAAVNLPYSLLFFLQRCLCTRGSHYSADTRRPVVLFEVGVQSPNLQIQCNLLVTLLILPIFLFRCHFVKVYSHNPVCFFLNCALKHQRGGPMGNVDWLGKAIGFYTWSYLDLPRVFRPSWKTASWYHISVLKFCGFVMSFFISHF